MNLLKESVIKFEFLILFLLIIPSVFLFFILFKKNHFPLNSEKKIENVVNNKLIPPQYGAFLGIWIFSPDLNELMIVEEKIKKEFKIVGIYQSWGDKNNNFNRAWAEALNKKEKIPLISWEPWRPIAGFARSIEEINQPTFALSNIINGKFDEYIINYAKDIKKFNKPVLIRFAHEMNGNWYPWGSTFNKPEEYIASWQHIHTLFKKVGAVNVTWIWSPNEVFYDQNVPNAKNLEKFYPGDEYVDWVGFSSFNWAGKYKQNVFRTPEAMYITTMNILSIFNKPIMITETASADTKNPTEKALWIQNLALFIKQNPKIKGIIWFNIEDNDINWKIDSTNDSKNAFTDFFDGYFFQN